MLATFIFCFHCEFKNKDVCLPCLNKNLGKEKGKKERERNCTKRQRGTVSLTLSHLPHIVTSLLIFKSLIQHWPSSGLLAADPAAFTTVFLLSWSVFCVVVVLLRLDPLDRRDTTCFLTSVCCPPYNRFLWAKAAAAFCLAASWSSSLRVRRGLTKNICIQLIIKHGRVSWKYYYSKSFQENETQNPF